MRWMASLLLASCATFPVNDEVPMAFRGYWVPQAQNCDAQLGLVVERDRLVLKNGTWRPAMTWLADYVRRTTAIPPDPSTNLSTATLEQNFPNPFNPETTIRFQVPRREKITLTLYNMLGQRVATLADKEMDPGFYAIRWNGLDEAGRDVATGLYIYRIDGDFGTMVRKMTLMK